jgi:MoaD family protein
VIKVTANFFSYIKFETGLDSLEVSVEDEATISDLIDTLESKYGEKLMRFIKNRDKNKYISIFIIDNKRCEPSQALSSGDVVMVMPTVAGG